MDNLFLTLFSNELSGDFIYILSSLILFLKINNLEKNILLKLMKHCLNCSNYKPKGAIGDKL